MDLTLRAAESILLMVVLFASAIALRGAGVLAEEHSKVFARAITQLILPALVFAHLAAHPVRLEMLVAPAVMLSSSVLFMLVGYVAGRWLFRLSRPSLGAFLLCAGLTSAAFLGIALVEIVYPHSPNMDETVMIAELGVGLPAFIFGPLVAAYFGSRDQGQPFSVMRGLLDYLRSPIFIAIVLGFLWGGFRLPIEGNLALDVLFATCRQLENSLVALVGLTVGLMLRPLPIKPVVLMVVFVAVLQLILQPLYLSSAATLLSLTEMQRESLILQGAAPVATLPAIFAREYGCDAQLAAALILATTLLSIASIPLVVVWLG